MDGSEEAGRISRLCAALGRITASLEPETVLREVVEGARALTGGRLGLNESAFVLITDSVRTIRKRFRSRPENEYTAIISIRYGISAVKDKGSTSPDSWIIR